MTNLKGVKALITYEAPFIPGQTPDKPGPLARFLPPLPDGIATAWLKLRFPEINPIPAPWVLDPFGTSPRLAIETARQGKRVLVAANNPIARFLLEMASSPPSLMEMQSVLADLAASQRAGERMEPHLRSLYTTHCAGCGSSIMAQAFFWERGATVPYARLYQCPHCGDSGEHPVTGFDIEQARMHSASGLHKSRALERVAASDDPDRIHAEEALAVYSPRAVYALFTLINKLDGLNLPPRRRDCLAAMLLVACDQANALWSVPASRERPLQLTIPPRYRENNIWLALEQSIESWTSSASPVPVTIWPAPPPEDGGICVFEGRFKDLLEMIYRQGKDRLPIQAVLTVLPRPNQAYWTLSALWAGWLWGRESVGPFKSVLRRRRYDWSWHSSGLTAAFSGLSKALPINAPLFAIACEADPGFLMATLSAGQLAGFTLLGLAMRTEPAQAQIEWRNESIDPGKKIIPYTGTALQAAVDQAQQCLTRLGQPAEYMVVQTAALTGLLSVGFFSSPTEPELEEKKTSENSPAQPVNLAVNIIRQALTFRGGFLRFNAGESPEVGQWWLRSSQEAEQPLYDRIEMSLVRFLIKNPTCELQELENSLCQEYPGFSTPDRPFIEICLESYAAPSEQDHVRWILRPQETPAMRRMDLERIDQQLKLLAKRLGFQCTGEFPKRWTDHRGQIIYSFYPIASAILGDIFIKRRPSTGQFSGQRFVIIPGGRANLVLYKLRHNPHLRSFCILENETPLPAEAPETSMWKFLKFRHIQRLLDHPLLQPENLPDLFAQDPLTFSAPQMRLF